MPKKSPTTARRAAKAARSRKERDRRASRPLPPPSASTPTVARVMTTEPGPRKASPTTVIRRPMPVLPSVAEYGYVMKDLARTGIVAGALLFFMVALAFFIR